VSRRRRGSDGGDASKSGVGAVVIGDRTQGRNLASGPSIASRVRRLDPGEPGPGYGRVHDDINAKGGNRRSQRCTPSTTRYDRRERSPWTSHEADRRRQVFAIIGTFVDFSVTQTGVAKPAPHCAEMDLQPQRRRSSTSRPPGSSSIPGRRHERSVRVLPPAADKTEGR